MSDSHSLNDAVNCEYLTFKLGTQEFGIDIELVQSVLTHAQYTQRNPGHSLVDLCKCGTQALARNSLPALVLVLSREMHSIGLVVNEVNDVISLAPHQLHVAPEDPLVDRSVLMAEGVSGTRTFLLIDFEALLASTDISCRRQLQPDVRASFLH